MNTTIHLDFETFSTVNLPKVGAYRYAQDPSTEALIACYAIGDAPVRTWLPYLQPTMPLDIYRALEKNAVICAHNAEFERQIWTHVLRLPVPRLHRWRCTAARAAAANLPRSLDGALKALAISDAKGQPIAKDSRGKRLVRLFCMPRKPTKKNAAIRLMPEDDKQAFAEFIEYCRQDVVSERTLDRALPDLSREEWEYFQYNMLVNDRGLPLDMRLIEQSTIAVRELERINLARVRKLTLGLAPTQRDKMQLWLKFQGADLKNLQLKTVNEALDGSLPPKVREVMELRLEASKASTKKIKAMAAVACEDGRAHGTMLYYGAHTGRLSGKLIQPHNFTRGLLTPEEQLIVLRTFATGDYQFVQMLFDKPMHMLAQSMRGFIRAPEGMRFVIADYGAIETRVLAWLANELKVLEGYRRGLDMYKLMAVVLYHVQYEDVSKEQRRIGKNLRLGAGYQLGVGGLLKNCEKEGIPMEKEFAEHAIAAYRKDNRNIVKLWYATEEACIVAVRDGKPQTLNGKLHFETWREWLTVTLPSGRNLYYFQPRVELAMKWGKLKPALSYFGERKKGPPEGISYADMPDRNNRVKTYGGKMVENIVQAVARDVMMYGMVCAEKKGYPALASIHDEIVTLRKHGEGSVKELEQVICTLPAWGKGLPLVAEGFECVHYRKG